MNKDKLVRKLREIVGDDGVIVDEDQLITYECDGMILNKSIPELVVLPRSTEQVSQIVKLANQESVPFTARGSGTGLNGGAISVKGGMLISLTRMNKILEIDLENSLAVVEAGVNNLEVTQAVSGQGYQYIPDPSSQASCTIGGNIAENAGGPHCLKYGVTTNYVLGLEVVLPDGRIIQLGGRTPDPPGYDLVGLMVGSEGTLGIVTKAILRLSLKPEAVRTLLAIFNTVDDAGSAVSDIIASGIVPVTLEMMDKLTIEAVEAFVRAGYPTDAEAVLIIEIDGVREGLKEVSERIIKICQSHKVREVRVARNEEEQALLWSGRKGAFGAIGRITRSYTVQDGVVPRTKLPEVLRKIGRIGKKYRLRIANVFHAGDGNLHPLIFFNEQSEEERRNVVQASSEILSACVDAGGSISGEHGIGLEKIEEMSLIFNQNDLKAMREIKEVIDPRELCNPGKILPELARAPRLCGEDFDSAVPA